MGKDRDWHEGWRGGVMETLITSVKAGEDLKAWCNAHCATQGVAIKQVPATTALCVRLWKVG